MITKETLVQEIESLMQTLKDFDEWCRLPITELPPFDEVGKPFVELVEGLNTWHAKLTEQGD